MEWNSVTSKSVSTPFSNLCRLCVQILIEMTGELTTALFEDADVEKRGALTYEALKAQLEKHGGLLENLSIR